MKNRILLALLLGTLIYGCSTRKTADSRPPYYDQEMIMTKNTWNQFIMCQFQTGRDVHIVCRKFIDS